MSKNILIIGRKLDPYPPFNDAVKNAGISLAEALARQGVKVYVLAFSKKLDRLIKRKEMNNVRYLSINPLKIPHFLFRLFFRAKGSFPTLLARLFCLFAGIDAVYMHGCSFQIPCKTVVHIYTHNFFSDQTRIPKTTYISAENESILRRVRSLYPDNPSNVFYPGINMGKFHPGTRKRSAGKPARFLFASSPIKEDDNQAIEKEMMESKGIFKIMNLGKLLAERSAVQVTLLWRKDPSYIKSLVQDYSFINIDAGYIVDMNSYLEDFDFCFCLFEDDKNVKGMPHSMIESMAKGVIPVVLKNSPLGKFIEENNAGVAIYGCDDKQDRDVEALLEILNNPDSYFKLSSNAITAAARFFDIEKNAGQMISILFQNEKQGHMTC